MIRITLLSISIFLSFVVNSQNITSRLRLESGGPLYFHFNTLEKYSTGLSVNDWMKLSVYFIDTTDAGAQNVATQWKLSVRSTRDKIYGDGGNELPLSTIEITTHGNDVGATHYNPIPISDLKTILIDNGSQTYDGVSTWLTDIFVSYHCGTTLLNNLLGKPPDYYNVDLIFTLESE